MMSPRAQQARKKRRVIIAVAVALLLAAAAIAIAVGVTQSGSDGDDNERAASNAIGTPVDANSALDGSTAPEESGTVTVDGPGAGSGADAGAGSDGADTGTGTGTGTGAGTGTTEESGAVDGPETETGDGPAAGDAQGPAEEAPSGAAPASCSGSNAWQTVDRLSLPFDLGETAAGVLTSGGKPYMVVVGEHPAGAVEEGDTLILDMESGDWYTAAERPFPGDHHAAEVVGNKLYLFGGLGADGAESALQIGTLAVNGGMPSISWSQGAALPFKSGSGNTALIGGKVYLCGGIDPDLGDRGDTVTTCAVYDPATDSWSTDVADMQSGKGRNHAAACTDGARLFVLGGRMEGNIVGDGFAESQVYDPSTDSWTVGPASGGSPQALPVGRGGMGKAIFHDGKCYVFGGEMRTNSANAGTGLTADGVYTRVDVFDTTTLKYIDGGAPNMPVGLHGLFPVKVGCTVHIAGGGVEVANSQSDVYLTYEL